MLGGEVARRYGGAGLPDDTIELDLRGTAGQSFGAFLPRGVTLRLHGDANDYVGKGLSGGRLVVRPDETRAVRGAEEQIIAGNTILYGATGGELFLRGRVGERFAVRNSGADGGRRGRGRPRLRVHDRRHGRGARRRPGATSPPACPAASAYVLATSTASGSTPSWSTSTPLDRRASRCRCRRSCSAHFARDRLGRRRGRCSSDWPEAAREFTAVVPRDYKRVMETRCRARRG